MVKTYENRVFQSNSNSEMIVNPFLFSLFFLLEMKYPLGKRGTIVNLFLQLLKQECANCTCGCKQTV